MDNVIQFSDGIARFIGKKDRYLRALSKWIVELKASPPAFPEEQTPEALSAFQSQIHTIKGVAGNLGAMVLSDAASHLEIAIKSGSFDKQSYDLFLAAYQKTVAAAQQFVDTEG